MLFSVFDLIEIESDPSLEKRVLLFALIHSKTMIKETNDSNKKSPEDYNGNSGSGLSIPEQRTMNHSYGVKGLGTHIGTHVLGLRRLLVSRDDSQDLRKNLGKDSDSEEESRDLTQNDSSSHFSGNGSCGWIRTNDLVVNSHPLYR